MNLIVGGTGALGSAIARRLLAAGQRVRLMTRSPEKAVDLVARGAVVIRGDLLDRNSLVGACQGAEVVVAAAHSILGRGRHASAHVDGAGHRHLIDAARDSGVRHFIYTSVYGDGPEFHAVPFFRIKREVEEHLMASTLASTILRPTAFMESHAHLLIGEPILRTGKTMLFGRGERLRNFVAADDVAAIAMRALAEPSLIGQTVDVGGPENMTDMDVVQLYERLSGRTAKITHVPIGILRVASRLLRPIHAGLSQIMEAALVAETTDQSFDARPLQARFGVTLTRLENWVLKRLALPASSSRPVY